VAKQKNTEAAELLERATSVGRDVMEKQQAAQPAAYGSRYEFSMDEGRIVPQGNADAFPDVLKSVRFNRTGEGTLEAYVPALANGRCTTMQQMAEFDYSPEAIAAGVEQMAIGDGKDPIRKAKRWKKKDPLVYKCIKVLTQLANSRPTIHCEDDEQRELVQMWFKKAMPHSFRKKWFTEYYDSSMVPVAKIRIPYKPRDYKQGKIPQTNEGNVELAIAANTATQGLLDRQTEMKGKFDQALAAFNSAFEASKNGLCSEERLGLLRKKVTAAQYEWSKGLIPAGYSVLDPLQIDIQGPKEMNWLREPYLRIGQELRDAIMKPTARQAEVIARLPFEIIDQVRNGADKVWLSPNIFSMTYGEKQDYERYPTPIVTHAQDALEMKYLLMAMDKATAKTIRDRILKVTIGNDTYPALDTTQMEQLAAVFNQPGRNLTIFWNHTLTIEYVEPKNTLLNDDKKYDFWNGEIRTAFGISSVITGTSDKTGSIGNSMLNLKGVEEEVDEGQAAFKEFFDGEIEMLKQSLGLKFDVKLSFDRMNLKDEAEYVNVLKLLVDAGIIDHETVIETLGYDYAVIEKRQKKIKPLQKQGKGIFVPQQQANKPPTGLQTGGRPKKSAKKSNTQKKGRSQPKKKAKAMLEKARAKLVPGTDGVTAYLVLDRAVAKDERKYLAERFGVPSDWVMSHAEYTAKTKQTVSWLPKLPELKPLEMFQAMRQGEGATERVKALANDLAENHRRAKGGKRGSYVTDTVKAELFEQAVAQVTQELKPEGVEDAEWGERMRYAVADLKEDFDGPTTKVYAAAMLARQYGKQAK
jgi:hypothetical protein